MTNHIETIATINLITVTGGGSSTSKQQVGVQGTLPKLGPVNVGGTNESSTTDYATCVSAVRKTPKATPADIAATCGMPPSN